MDVPQLVRDISERPEDAGAVRRLVGLGLAGVSAVAHYLAENQAPIDSTERLEAVVKVILSTVLRQAQSVETVLDVIRVQKELGFFLKYKSYAVKAASPLGYSVFLQRPGEGFSFQRHLTHKVELFHILEAAPGALAFICSHDAWRAVFEPNRFRKWLAGTADEAIDALAFSPRPGDVFAIEQVNVVHTVLGCILEEFATVSVDMVDRLYDQNVGREIPPTFTRDAVLPALRSLPVVEPTDRVLATPEGFRREPIEVHRRPWGELRTIACGPLRATHLVVNSGARTEARHDLANTLSVFVRFGTGIIAIGDADTIGRATPPLIDVASGDLLTIPAKTHWFAAAGESSELRLSLHALPLATALVERE